MDILAIITAATALAATLLSGLLWEKDFRDTAIVLRKEHVPKQPNPLAEYDAYVTGDDTLLFSYYPQKWRLHLRHRRNRVCLEVEEDEYRRINVGDTVTLHCRQKVIFRFIKVVRILV